MAEANNSTLFDKMMPRMHINDQEATSTGVEAFEMRSPQRSPPTIMAGGMQMTTDEESPPPRYTRENDPFQLSSKLKSSAEIESMVVQANTSRKRSNNSNVVTRNLPVKVTSSKRLQGFYENQNEAIQRMLKTVDEHVQSAKDVGDRNQFGYRVAIYGSFAANVILSVLQIYGALSSGSLSLFTTMADAIFDPLSNLTLLLCNHAVRRVDPNKFPAGKARIETAGNICFCFLMTSVSFILIAFSVRELAGGDSEAETFHVPSIVAVSVAFAVKLALFLYCFALRNQVSQVRILWEDHRNDLFINGFGILTSVGGSKLRWWIDPMGSIILSVLISCLWLYTAYSEFQSIIGVTADIQMQQLITYICMLFFPPRARCCTYTNCFQAMTHSSLITAIDTVRAYTSGPRLLVEVDIVMDRHESLQTCHDVSEELQMKLESLPNVERSFVHVDFETTHKPEHFLKKDL